MLQITNQNSTYCCLTQTSELFIQLARLKGKAEESNATFTYTLPIEMAGSFEHDMQDIRIHINYVFGFSMLADSDPATLCNIIQFRLSTVLFI